MLVGLIVALRGLSFQVGNYNTSNNEATHMGWCLKLYLHIAALNDQVRLIELQLVEEVFTRRSASHHVFSR